jgi:hypothetical protein
MLQYPHREVNEHGESDEVKIHCMPYDRRCHLALSDCVCYWSPLLSYNTVSPEIVVKPSGANVDITGYCGPRASQLPSGLTVEML